MDTDRIARLEETHERGWRSGLANLWRKETIRWWRTGNWLRQALIWLLLLDGLYTIMLLGATRPGTGSNGTGMDALQTGLVFYVSFLMLMIAVGAIIQAQSTILDDRLRGTAAWVLSKPVSRSALVLSKCAALPGMLLTMVVIPGLVAELQLSVALGRVPPAPALALLLGWLAGSLVFCFCMTLLLSTLLFSRAAVIGGSLLILLVAGQLAQHVPVYLIQQQWAIPALIELALVGAGALCLALASLRFAREEF